jgi:hypothetical protein
MVPAWVLLRSVPTKFRYEHRKRGILGWLFLIAFWLFNGLMLLLIVADWLNVGGALSTERLGAYVGAVIIPVYLWVVGDLILGLCAYVTRGRRSIIVGSDHDSEYLSMDQALSRLRSGKAFAGPSEEGLNPAEDNTKREMLLRRLAEEEPKLNDAD